MRATLLILIACAGSALQACTPADYSFGETHRWNIEQQVVDPDPHYAGDLIEGGTGQRVADAVDRYNKGEVTAPAQVNTTSTTGSGSGASSGTGPR
jgi:hypothetical protein